MIYLMKTKEFLKLERISKSNVIDVNDSLSSFDVQEKCFFCIIEYFRLLK